MSDRVGALVALLHAETRRDNPESHRDREVGSDFVSSSLESLGLPVLRNPDAQTLFVVEELVTLLQLSRKRVVLLEQEHQSALESFERANSKLSQMRAQMNAAKAKQDCAIEERNRFESLAKKSQEEMKKMAASKAIIEKQFLFDLKKERKTSAAAQPKSHAGMTSKFEARSNLRAEKMIRSLQEENRELRARIKVDDANAGKKLNVPVEQPALVSKVQNEQTQISKMRIDLEMAKEELKLEKQKKEMMHAYLKPSEEAENIVSNVAEEQQKKDELDQFFQMLSPIKK